MKVVLWTETRLSIAARLRAEAERARQAPKGKHPEIDVMTHAAALRYAADLVEGTK